MRERFVIFGFAILIILGLPRTLFAQSTDDEVPFDLFNLDLDNLDKDDSIAIFLLLDDLIETPKSSLVWRSGFGSGNSSLASSQVIRQNTYTSLSYNHKSGASIDVLSNFSSRYAPNFYNLGISAGYLGSLATKSSYSFTYEYNWFNNVTEENSELDFSDLAHTFSSYVDYKFKSLTFGLDYSHFLGTKIHRITPSVSSFISLRKTPFLKRFVFAPTVFALFGNDSRIIGTYYSFNQGLLANYPRVAEMDFNDINDNNYASFVESRPRLVDFLENSGVVDAKNIESSNLRGLNTIISLPLLYTKGRFSTLINYSINIPFKKTTSYQENFENKLLEAVFNNTYIQSSFKTSNYFSFSISYTIIKS